jgi:hypothetical protein
MKLKHLTLLVLAASTLVLALAVPSAQAAPGTTYSLSAAYTTSCTGDVVCISSTYDWSGTATCSANCTGAPQSGTFTIHLAGSGPYFPPSPCISKRVTGSFSATWSDATFTTAQLSGRSRDGKSYLIAGTTDATSTAYPPQPMKGSLRFPPDSCSAGFPPQPMFVTFG